MRRKIFLSLVLALGTVGLGFGQVVFGKYSELELGLETVPFQPDAKVVTLWEEANSYFVINGLSTDYHYRFKVLDDNHENFGDILIPYYRGKYNTEDISKIQAQVSYIENGGRKTFVLTKSEIKEVNLGGGEFQYVLVFPHVKKGSILELKYRKLDQEYGILEGWAFQKKYPALFSKYSFKAPDFFQYQMIMQGKQVAEAAEISERKNQYSWLRKDIPSLPNEPFVGNLLDYQERVDGYLFSSQYVSSNQLENSEIVYSSWSQLANTWLQVPDMNSYFIQSPESIPDYPTLKLDSLTKIEQAKKIYHFVANEIKYLESSWIEPIYPLDVLLKKKEGNSFDKNLLFLHLLRRSGFEANLVLINERYRGRTQLIPVPFINQFHTCLVQLNLEGNQFLVDASDPNIPFGMLPVEKVRDRGFVLEFDMGRLEDLTYAHRSGSIQMVRFEKLSDGSMGFKSQIKFLDQEALAMSQYQKGIKDTVELLKDDQRFDRFDISNLSSLDQLESQRSFSIFFDAKLEEPKDELLYLTPFAFSKFFENPFVQNDRVLPVEFNYPFFENINASIPIPQGFELEDYPESVSITNPSKTIRFNFLINKVEDELKISSRLEFSTSAVPVSEYGDLKVLMETVSAKLKSPVILKKT
ncbi:MAG: DUF3857 domain-containing protein, partial [Cytophagales bacterium]